MFEIDLETTEPDDIMLSSYNIFIKNSQFMNIAITHSLHSNETVKKILFEFPEDIRVDTQLGLSLGKKKVKQIRINQIDISFGNTKFVVTPDNIEDYFTTNKFVEYDKEAQLFQTKSVDGKHNPMIFLRKKFLTQLENE